MSEPVTTVRFSLDNGLRVVVDPRPAVSRVAVCVHYGVGFRSEDPGEAGLAHLFEHLMFRGSASLPAGRFYDHVHELGGYANGTTHQDYTDYHQVVAVAGLARALFAEADRMRAPLFTPDAVREQIIGVGQEIDQVTRDRPFGGFPWPLLPGLLFDDFAHAHDGYGHLEQLRAVTPEVCRRFFDLHYAPGNAVLTVSGGLEVRQTVELIHRFFADIPGGTGVVAPPAVPPPLRGDRIAEFGESGVELRATAVGYRIDGYDTDPDGYLDQLVLGRVLAQESRRSDGPHFDASAGFFGPLDARTPEVALLVTAGDPAVSPAQVTGRLDRLLAGWACADRAAGGAVPIAQAVRSLRVDHRTALDDLMPRARLLGRFELLFGGADRAEEVDGRLAAVDPARIGRAADLLAGSTRAVLTLAPAARRTRPAPPPVADVGAGAHGRSAARPTDHRPLPVPDLGSVERAEVPVDVVEQETVATGEPFVVVRRPGAPVELRARWSLTPAGWAGPERVQRVLAAVARECSPARGAAEDGGALGVPGTGAQGVTLRSDGQWLTLSGRCLPADLPALTAGVAATLRSWVRHEQSPVGDGPRVWPGWLGGEFALADQLARSTAATPGASVVVGPGTSPVGAPGTSVADEPPASGASDPAADHDAGGSGTSDLAVDHDAGARSYGVSSTTRRTDVMINSQGGGGNSGGGDGDARRPAAALLDVGSGAVVLVGPDLPVEARRDLAGAFVALGGPTSGPTGVVPSAGPEPTEADPGPPHSPHSTYAGLDLPDADAEFTDAGRLLLVPTAPGGHRELTLAVPDDRHAMHDPARYLATAVLGGYARSRLTRRAGRRPDAEYRLFAGYDRVAGTSRSVVRATVPPARPQGDGAAGDPLATALQDIHDVLAEWDTDPVTDGELLAARRYCAAQLPLAVDSAAGCADLLVHLLTTGGDVQTLRRAPDRLWTVPVAEVRQAGRRLTGGAGRRAGLVVVGPADGVVELAARHDYHPATPTPVR